MPNFNNLNFDNIPTPVWFIIIGIIVYWYFFKRKK
jgi:ribose/xylose/arabinose/galactoside ABC-type transport system permease subunit